MSDDIVDPPDPPEVAEGSTFRAKDLKNKALIVQATGFGTAPGKDKEGNPADYEYVACNVWILDRAGVVEYSPNVQISWWRAKEQLRNIIGRFVPCQPVTQDDNSIILVSLKDDLRKVAERAIEDIKSHPDEDPF